MSGAGFPACHSLLEQPEIEGDNQVFKKPAVWTWVRKHAENIIERRRIFKNVFGLSTIPDDVNRKELEKTRNRSYEDRNAIAHGRKGVKMPLAEYIEVEVFAAKCMLHLSNECREKMKCIV